MIHAEHDTCAVTVTAREKWTPRPVFHVTGRQPLVPSPPDARASWPDVSSEHAVDRRGVPPIDRRRAARSPSADSGPRPTAHPCRFRWSGFGRRPERAAAASANSCAVGRYARRSVRKSRRDCLFCSQLTRSHSIRRSGCPSAGELLDGRHREDPLRRRRLQARPGRAPRAEGSGANALAAFCAARGCPSVHDQQVTPADVVRPPCGCPTCSTNISRKNRITLRKVGRYLGIRPLPASCMDSIAANTGTAVV